MCKNDDICVLVKFSDVKIAELSKTVKRDKGSTENV